jgi:hypothetical protein
MKSLPLNALQTGLYARLKAAIPDIHGYDPANVPDNAKPPYWTLGEPTARPSDTQGMILWECTRTLHVWSDKRSHIQAQDILDRMTQALTDTDNPLVVAGFSVITIDPCDMVEVFSDPESGYIHGVMRVRVSLQQQ